MSNEDEPCELPIDGVLDLHMFHPSEAREVIEAYFEACQEAGIREIRIIHGKGVGTLREYVHTLLGRHPGVASYCLAPADGGGWGATLVRLKPGSPHPTS